MAIAPQYDDIGFFSNGLCEVLIAGKACIIDRTGKVLFASERTYSSYARHSDGLMKFSTRGKWGFLDASGKVAIPCRFDDVGEFSEGLCVVRQGDERFFIDTGGMPATRLNGAVRELERASLPLGFPCLDMSLSRFSDGLVLCFLAEGAAFLDRQGQTVLRLDRSAYRCVGDFENGLCVSMVRESQLGTRESHADRRAGDKPQKGRVLASAWSDYADSPEEEHEEWHFGIIDKRGRLVCRPLFDRIKRSPAGVFAVKRGDKWGLLNRRGREIFPAVLDDVCFVGGLVEAARGGRKLWLDSAGEPVFSQP